MKQTRKATLTDGREVEYVADLDRMMEGGMKQVFFTPDRSSVVCFYKDQADPIRQARLEAIIGKLNPTLGSCGEYWRRVFCWPTGLVMSPRLGIVCPVYPSNFFHEGGPWKGHVKDGTWFLSRTVAGKPFRDLMPESERGTWISYFSMCSTLARAVRRLHHAGLAHSDLAHRQVLLDPSRGQCMLIGCEDLVVPGTFPPDVMGTYGYIAPEVLETCHLPMNDPNRKHPCITTDLHALAVLIYQLLLIRHPLKGPKINSTLSAEEDDRLSMGEKALFIEHPEDHSNRPDEKQLAVRYEVLGPHLAALFNRAFIDGLHEPQRRPTAAEWESALVKTADLLHPCSNPDCTHRWFVVRGKGAQRCPFCGTQVPGTVLRLGLLRTLTVDDVDTWASDGEVVVYNGLPLFKWHVYDNVRPDETLSDTDRELLADCQYCSGRWLLINRNLDDVVSPSGKQVARNTAVELRPGARIRLSTKPHGRITEVAIVHE